VCSYCGCESIDVVGRFMREHVEIINATGDLRRAAEGHDPALVNAAVTTVRALLEPHAAAEESGLFAVLAEDAEFTDHVHGRCLEHTTLHQLLDRLAAGSHALFPVFEKMLRAHIDREENGLFPAAAIAFAGLEWERVTALTPGPEPSRA
jgi:hemerythrin-like domain-containing protein